MNEDQVLEVLQKVGAFRGGHFVYTSGRHGDTYVNKDALYPHTRYTSELCREIAQRFKGAGIEAVIGPAVAAALMAQWTAHHLTEMRGSEVYATYADKDGSGGFIIKRGYDKLIAGKKTLIVEDLTTTGGSVLKVISAARAVGADVVGVSVLCNRGGITARMLDVPVFEPLVSVELDSWDEGECELCKTNIPVNPEVGHGKDFLAHKK